MKQKEETQEKNQKLYPDYRTRELKNLQKRDRKIRQNLESYKYHNFWTQPYQDFSGPQAVNLGTNLVKQSLYTGIGEVIGSIIPSVLKTSKLKFLSKSIDEFKDIPNYEQYYKEAVDYITSPELRNQLVKLDKEFNTNYVEALDRYVDYNLKKYNSVLPVVKGNLDEATHGGVNFDYNDILNLDKYKIIIDNHINRYTLEHEFKHHLETLEAGIRASRQGIPITNKKEFKEFINNSPRNQKVFQNNLKDPADIVLNGPTDDFMQNIQIYNYLNSPTELNSQLTPLVKEQFLKGKYNQNLDMNDVLDICRTTGENSNLTIILGQFIKNRVNFIKDWNKYKYLAPFIYKNNKDDGRGNYNQIE